MFAISATIVAAGRALGLVPPPKPPRVLFKGVMQPMFFKQKTWGQFRDLELKDDDVLLVSFPKAGTTWMHQILYALLHYDDDGNCDQPSDAPGRNGALYPEWLPLTRPAKPSFPTGTNVYSDLVEQPSPRLFSTHLPGKELLPEQLTSTKKGKMIYVLRNPKDAMASLHFFMGEAKDGWLGNEHGAGSYNRFIAEPNKNPFGSFWGHCELMQPLIDEVGAGRATVVYYEHLKADLEGEVQRLAAFLGVGTVTDAKMDAITKRVSLKSMREAEGTKKLVRKGVIGDHVNYLDAEKWAKIDEMSQERLGTMPIFQPLLKY